MLAQACEVCDALTGRGRAYSIDSRVVPER